MSVPDFRPFLFHFYTINTKHRYGHKNWGKFIKFTGTSHPSTVNSW